MARNCLPDREFGCFQPNHEILNHLFLCRGMAGHYDQESPSSDFESLWRTLQQQTIEVDKDEHLDDRGVWSVLRNGIMFPIWKMRSCAHNDSGRGCVRPQVRAASQGGQRLKIFWHQVSHEAESSRSAASGDPSAGSEALQRAVNKAKSLAKNASTKVISAIIVLELRKLLLRF